MIEIILLLIFEITLVVLLGIFAFIGQYGVWIALAVAAYFIYKRLDKDLSTKKKGGE